MAFPPPDPAFWDRILWLWKGLAPWDPIILFRDIFPVFIAILCLYHSYKTFGWWKTTLFFVGSFLFTSLEENVWILVGYFSGTPTYYFSPEQYYLWFGVCPLSVAIGWFFISYSVVYIATKLFKNRGVLTRAAVGGLLAMNLDLMVDPIAVRNLWWAWPQAETLATQQTTFWILGIPVTNFIGWFLLIFFFAILWEKVPPKEETWKRKKTTGVFFLYLAGLLGLTLLILVGAQILIAVLHVGGLNIGDPYFPIWWGGP
jgi:uncharacterized membrane protein